MAVLYRGRAKIIAALTALLICLTAFANAQTKSQDSGQIRKENKPKMTTHATGTFEVKMTPQTTDDKDAVVGRYLLDKKFSGDLEGTSKGEMLAIGTAVEGSAGYVAMEKITATLNGRTGTFSLQHSGTMTRGAGQLTITVIPDSGTGQLAGLSGRMDIKIADGKHYYDFEYAVAEAP